MNKILVLIIVLFTVKVVSQSAPIIIDGNFDDWTENLTTFTDLPETVDGIDILEIQVTNDENFLFIKVKTDTEFVLTENDFSQTLDLQIDADNNSETGFVPQVGFGTEIGIIFRNRFAYFNIPIPAESVSFSDLTYRSAPAYSSKEFEIAIARAAVPNGIDPLFTSETIKILFRNLSSSEFLPNEGDVLSYTFDETPVPVYEPIDLTKGDSNHIRTMSYNTLNNGLTDPNRVANFSNIISIINPDIIAFQECWVVTAEEVKGLLDTILPIGGDGWYVLRNGFNITASRWQVLQTWNFLDRQFPVLIDLPSSYPKDLLVTNAHLKAGNFDNIRQQQVDEYASFILDAKTPDGNITLPNNTPFIYTGDLNMYGLVQQLTTLLTGDIQDTETYGDAGTLDWDNTDLTSVLALQTDNRMAYTWRADEESFGPGKLDYIIFSDATLRIEKAFVIQTEVMPNDRLALYGFDQLDTSTASDHFPIVTDFSLKNTLSTPSNLLAKVAMYPNPVKDILTIDFQDNQRYKVAIYDSFGSLILSRTNNAKKVLTINLKNIEKGVYFVKIMNNKKENTNLKIIKI